MKALLSNYRQSPRKVRLMADLVRGRSLETADRLLQFTVKRAAAPLRKLLRSAAANAGPEAAAATNPPSELFVKNITVNSGLVYRRFHPGAHGRAYPIHKKTSHVEIELGRRPIKETAVKIKPKKVKK